ncbi:MAG: alanine racemase [Treponema sp.]|nr:alanine racemase [Treponema sp.]
MKPTIAKIYIENLRHNLKFIRSRINPDAKMCVAVKADAYGHGAVRCAKEAVECGADFLAVARVSEGIELRENGISVPILLLSLCDLSEMADLVKFDITPLVYDEEYIRAIENAVAAAGKKNYSVHLAVDTGMGRIGCQPEDAVSLAKIIDSSEKLSLGGMCTHFATADSYEREDVDYTNWQFDRFLYATESVRNAGINPGIRHCANSALTLNRPETHLDMCRPGIIVYGYYPGDLKGKDLKPVMALTTKIVSIRDFKKGKSVSYGRTWTATSDTKIGVIPIGYDDGLFRRFAGKISVAINGKPYPIRGRICMDQCMVDLGEETKVKRWDEVVIFGPEESGALQSADTLANLTDTISYEITCQISKRVERIFV